MSIDLPPGREASSHGEIWVVAWPWLVLALGVLVVVAGGIFFTPA